MKNNNSLHQTSLRLAGELSVSLIKKLMKLYKYIPEEHLNKFVKNGSFLFRNLVFFQKYEEDNIRGDYLEGTRVFKPKNGLKINIENSGTKILNGKYFTSTIESENIFIFCLSKTLSNDLFLEFKTNICVEIINQGKIYTMLENILFNDETIKPKKLYRNHINYYKNDDLLGTHWALPEKIITDKSEKYFNQNEYRIYYSKNNAMQFQNVKLKITENLKNINENKNVKSELISIGDISKYIKIHKKKTG